jgi:peptide/nickel transport system ATP-binding protein
MEHEQRAMSPIREVASQQGRPGQLLEVRDLRTEIHLKNAVVHAVDGIDMTVTPGEGLGLVGESGSGKTMTAMSIERLLPAGGRIAGGQVRIDGAEVLTMREPALRRLRGDEIGLISQNPTESLNPVVPIGVQVAEALRLHRDISKEADRNRVIEMLGEVGLPSAERCADSYPHQLSGGQQQRVMIAMALICEPKLLIADEPTTALDVTIQKQILELIDRMREELGMAVILVTHDLGVIAGHTDRVAVMYAGQIVELAGTDELFAEPRHRYTEALMEALPDRAGSRERRLYTIPGLPPDLTEPVRACRFAPRCRFATEVCRTQDPPVVQVAGTEHEYACFHPRGEPEQAGKLTAQLATPTASAWAETEEHSWVGPRTPAPDDGVALLDIKDVVRNFPVTSGAILKRKIGEVSAVAGVNLRIERGRTVGLAGESGCGKTTLGRLVVGLDEPTSGEILFRGRRIDRMRRTEARMERRNIQLMFQDAYGSLDPRMRVRSILREPLEIQHIGTSRDRDQRVDELLDAVGLPSKAAQRYPHEFSGGQRQRVGLARALALQPGLIVADEPVSALDVSVQAQVLNLMRELQQDHGLTYLFISHDLAVVRYLSDVIAVMYLGKLVEVGPAEEVYNSPQHHYTRALLDTIPVADPLVERRKRKLGMPGEVPSALNPPSGCRFRTRCPMAQQICAQTEPPLASLEGITDAVPGDMTHMVACHFPLAGSASPTAKPADPSVTRP